MPPSAKVSIHGAEDILLVFGVQDIERTMILPSPLSQEHQRPSLPRRRRRRITKATISGSHSPLSYRDWLIQDTPEAFLSGFLPLATEQPAPPATSLSTRSTSTRCHTKRMLTDSTRRRHGRKGTLKILNKNS
jgi:hypothetical protein